MHKYYSIMRPVGPGTAPRGFVEFENYENKKYIEEIGREAWGFLIYKEPLKNPEEWDLIEGGNNMKKRLYLAYGSNLSIEQMAYRCPDAEIIGRANIKDYELLFKGSKTGSYATIEPKQGSYVPVLVWAISARDERNLDLYEGCPTFYYKKNLEVEVLGLGDDIPAPSYGTHKAMVYIMDERRRLGMPSQHYYDVLDEGYKRFGFDRKILQAAVGKQLV